MARPKEFDREEALRRAIPVFWEKGFAGTSTDDLVGAMGIGRQSLYDTFGDKRRLFLAALHTYNTDGITALLRKLRAGPTALAAIERILVDLAEVREKARALGCMGVNAICEMARVDDEVRALTQTSAALLEATLTDAIEDGKAKGDVSPKVLRDVAAFAVDSLRPR